MAISRCTDLNNVTFYDYDEAEERDLLLGAYFRNKIDNYKKQDRSAKRKISKDKYINVKWFLDNLGKQCIYCNEILDYSVEDDKIVCNLTADRKDNNQPHDLDNIQPVCCHCNCSKSNRLMH